MKRTRALSNLIIFLSLTFLVTSCTKESFNGSNELSLISAAEDSQELANGYTISVFDSSLTNDLPWRDELSFKIIKLRYMNDLSIEEEINKNIKNSMTSWISGEVLNSSSVDFEIYCHSNKYISFVNLFEYSSRRLDYIRDYITIDLETGKRIMLNDLIQLDTEFVEHIQKRNLIRDSINPMAHGDSEGLWEYLNGFAVDELLNELKECSYTQEQVIQNGYAPIDESIGTLVFRNSFFLQNKKLVMVLNGDKHITFSLDDISDFLKVEKW